MPHANDKLKEAYYYRLTLKDPAFSVTMRFVILSETSRRLMTV